MRIGELSMNNYYVPNLYNYRASAPEPVSQNETPAQQPNSAPETPKVDPFGMHASLTISPEARSLYEASLNQDGGNGGEPRHTHTTAANMQSAPVECSSCASRTYVCSSGATTSGVSSNNSASFVAAHEADHLSDQRADAESQGKDVVAQNMRMYTSLCGECGKVYVSGGKAETLTAAEGQAGDDEPLMQLFDSLPA
jgi:hypothetical protein